MIVAIYVRVSTDQQAEKGYSLDTQLLDCKTKANELDYVSLIEEYVDDGYSGAYMDRPALERLRNGIRDKRFGAVIVYDPDRLARNLTHQLIITDEIESSGAQLIFVNFEWQDTPEGKLFYSIRGAVSAYEREKIRERMLRGKRGKALAGKVIRNNRPYGYGWNAERSVYVVNEEEAKMIRQIFNWCINEHLGIRAIATRLAELEYPTRTERRSWNIGTVHDILTRETYCGVHWVNKEYKSKVSQNKFKRGFRDESEWIPVQVPAIISRETWEAAQRQLQLNKRITKKPITYDYICRNLVVCPLCNTPMRTAVSGTKHKPYYICKTGRAVSGKTSLNNNYKCPARQIPADVLDRHVWLYISNILQNPEILSEELNHPRDQNEAVKEALERLAVNESQLLREREKITLLFRQDLIDQEMAEKQLTEIKQSLAQIKITRQKLETELINKQSNDITRKVSDLIEYADTEDPVMQRQIILSLVQRIEAQRVDHNYNSPEINVHVVF
jgi:site-specific DNA recombinase